MLSASPTTFDIHDLAFERNNRLLFSGMNHTIAPGELLEVKGRNGSGKSTLLRILAGLIEPHHGSVLYQGKKLDPQAIHYVGHQNGIKTHLTVRENLQLWLAVAAKKSDLQHIDHITQLLGIHHLQHTPALSLSAGQARRVALARLLLYPAPIWLLDEPVTALDAQGQQLFETLLSQQLAQNGIVIMALHQPLNLACVKHTLQIGEPL